jgi:RNA polymerase sigma factor (sigma-70 family)
MISEKRQEPAQSTGKGYLTENGTASTSSRENTNAGQISSLHQESGSRNGHKERSAEGTSAMSLHECLVQMIRRLTPNPTLREDLLQEATIHLWRTEMRRPGQTRSWYLQSCLFRLQHYLNSGRSIDSTKRWRDQLLHTEFSEDVLSPGEQADSGNSIFTCVNAREILALLTPHLSPQERAVLVCLAEGLGAREIGRKLNLSHTMAIRHRRKIATLFKRLELQSATDVQLFQTNGSRPRNGRS